MTHSLIDEAAHVLLNPTRLFTVGELRERSDLIPGTGGVYAWWFSKVPPEVPIESAAIHEGRRLLYVGIAPRKPSASGSVSDSTLRNRLLNHCRGPIAGSTLRRTLAVLLEGVLGLSISPTKTGKLKMPPEHEARLTRWMADNVAVAWAVSATPWEIEDHMIQTVRLPLNIRGSSDPFARVLSKMRSRIWTRD